MTYLDFKHTTWSRLYFSDDANVEKIINKLEKGFLPSELCDDPELKFVSSETLYDTEEYITPQENQGNPTIELYTNTENQESWQEEIWNNVEKKL